MKSAWLCAIVAPALIFGIATAAPAAAAAKGVTSSANFAGYEALANESSVQSFQYVQATFTVPSLNCTETPTATVTQLVSLVANNTTAPKFHNADIMVFDLTTGASAGAPLSTTCGANPAAAVFTNSSGTVADFTQVGLRQIQVEASNQSTMRPLVSPGWSTREYLLRGPSRRADVKPEALLSGKYTSSFANDWYAPN
jgi:hypothetical protein